MNNVKMNLVPGETRLDNVALPADGLLIEIVVPDGVPPCSGNLNILYANGVTGHTMSAVMSATPGGPALALGVNITSSVNPTEVFYLGGKVYPGGYYPTLKAGSYFVTVMPQHGAVEADLTLNLHQYKG